MFDWAFEAAFKNIMMAIRFLIWCIRGVIFLVSAIFNRRQNVPRSQRSDIFD